MKHQHKQTDSVEWYQTVFAMLLFVFSDTTPPTISIRTGQSCDGSYVITVQKYSRLSNYLPDILYSDNDRIESFTVTPDDANTTANIESATDVTWTAKDYTGNTRSCTVKFVIRGRPRIFTTLDKKG